jgi:hypothetical protein
MKLVNSFVAIILDTNILSDSGNVFSIALFNNGCYCSIQK